MAERTEAVKLKISEAAKRRWAKPEFRAHMADVADRFRKKRLEPQLCACGCGVLAASGNRYVLGHNSKSEHPMLGKKHSRETLAKLSQSHQGPRLWRMGFTHTKEARKRMSESHRGVPLSEECRKNIGLAHRGKPHPKAKGRISPMKGRHQTENARKVLSEKAKRWWSNPDNAKKCLVFNSPNRQEKRLQGILDLMYPGEWRFVGDGQVIIGGKCPDFINVNGQKKIIELYGERWHQEDEPPKRVAAFKPFGYETLVIWVKDLQCIRRLKPILRSFCGDA